MRLLFKTLKRAGLGFLLGIAIGNVMAAIFTSPDVVSAALLAKAGTRSAALLLQTLGSGVIGAVAFASVSFYDIERWSLLQTAVVHFIVIEAAYLPVALWLGWLEGTKETLIWLLSGAVTYLIIFLIMSAIYRAQVRKLSRMQEQNETKNQNQKE